MALAALLVLLIVLGDFRGRREVVARFLPTLFGMGVDTSIHLRHRMREEGRQNMSTIAATTGAAGFMSADTTTMGSGTLALATNPGLQSIGWLAPIGIMLCYLTSMLFTCSLMTLWNPRSEPISEPAQSLKTE